MDLQLALEKEQQLGISRVQIVREEYEMVLLNKIFDGPLGSRLVLRGGTALRLAYGSPRFSEDLDFSQVSQITEQEFKDWGAATAQFNPNLELVEALKKYYTLFALFRLKDPTLPETISLKLEISTRDEKWEKDKDYLVKGLKSEVTPLTVLAQVASLARISQEKRRILPLRSRDVFDLWFIGQQIGKPWPMDFSRFEPKEIKRDLNRLLAKGARRLLEPWLPKEG